MPRIPIESPRPIAWFAALRVAIVAVSLVALALFDVPHRERLIVLVAAVAVPAHTNGRSRSAASIGSRSFAGRQAATKRRVTPIRKPKARRGKCRLDIVILPWWKLIRHSPAARAGGMSAP